MTAISKPIRYVCERCGKRAIFGKHFCTDADVERAKFFRERRKYLWYAGVAVLLLTAIGWTLAGVWGSLMLLLYPFAVYLILENGKPRRKGDRYDELISIVGGDDALAKRLVESARKRYPDKPFPELVSYAIDRIQRDRGR